MLIINAEDRTCYLKEQLGNINKFYFEPFFDEAVPYKTAFQGPVADRRATLN
jgi:hypothetical protein